MNLLHSYSDPFAADPRAQVARDVAQARRTLAVLGAELDRIDAKLDALYRAQERIPCPTVAWCEFRSWEAEAKAEERYEAEYERIERQISRLNRRADAILRASWEISERLSWGGGAAH